MSPELLFSLFFVAACSLVAYLSAIKPQREEDRRRADQEFERSRARLLLESQRRNKEPKLEVKN